MKNLVILAKVLHKKTVSLEGNNKQVTAGFLYGKFLQLYHPAWQIIVRLGGETIAHRKPWSPISRRKLSTRILWEALVCKNTTNWEILRKNLVLPVAIKALSSDMTIFGANG